MLLAMLPKSPNVLNTVSKLASPFTFFAVLSIFCSSLSNSFCDSIFSLREIGCSSSFIASSNFFFFSSYSLTKSLNTSLFDFLSWTKLYLSSIDCDFWSMLSHDALYSSFLLSFRFASKSSFTALRLLFCLSVKLPSCSIFSTYFLSASIMASLFSFLVIMLLRYKSSVSFIDAPSSLSASSIALLCNASFTLPYSLFRLANSVEFSAVLPCL